MRLLALVYHQLRASYYDHLLSKNHPDADVSAAWVHHRTRADALAQEIA